MRVLIACFITIRLASCLFKLRYLAVSEAQSANNRELISQTVITRALV